MFLISSVIHMGQNVYPDVILLSMPDCRRLQNGLASEESTLGKTSQDREAEGGSKDRGQL